MKIPVENWDGELAVRLPDWLVDRYRVREGDEIDMSRLEAYLAREAEEGRQPAEPSRDE